MDGNDDRERAAFGGGDGMLEFPDVVSDVERCSGRIYRVRGDYGDPRFYYDFNQSNPVAGRNAWNRLTVETGCEELV